MKLELVPEHLSGQRRTKDEMFDQLDQNLSLVALDTREGNPWVGRFDRRKSVRNDNISANITKATFGSNA